MSHSSECSDRAPFPKLPGEGRRLGSYRGKERGFVDTAPDDLEHALGDADRPPALMMTMLSILRRNPQARKPPPLWAEVMSSDESAGRAGKDWAIQAGLSFGWTTDDQIVWTRDDAPIERKEAEAIIFVACRDAVRADLDKWQESPRDAFDRIEREWAAYRAPRNAAAEAERHRLTARFMKRSRWSIGSVLWWIAYADAVEAMEGPAQFESAGSWWAAISLAVTFEPAPPRRVADPWQEFAEACADGRIQVYGFRNNDEQRIPQHLMEDMAERKSPGERFRFSDDGQSAHAPGGPSWTKVSFDVASVLAAYPPDIVLVVVAVLRALAWVAERDAATAAISFARHIMAREWTTAAPALAGAERALLLLAKDVDQVQFLLKHLPGGTLSAPVVRGGFNDLARTFIEELGIPNPSKEEIKDRAEKLRKAYGRDANETPKHSDAIANGRRAKVD